MTLPKAKINSNSNELDIQVLVKNERVVVCKISGAHTGPFYLQYHSAAGWKDLDHGDTALSRRMPAIVNNPFELV